MNAARVAAPVGGPFDAGGRYVVREVLGSGAFGIVYRVLDRRWDQEVALKTLLDTTPEGRQWLKAEYRALRDIVHPNLVRLHELHIEGERCFFTMEVVPGGLPFTDRLGLDPKAPEEQQAAAIRGICQAGLQLAEALATVHASGKSHRDVKPTNVLVSEEGHVTLLDFGMATPVSRARLLDTARGVVLGTLPYLAPEQYWDPKPLPASDWYSVGLVLYEALAGRLPFGDDPSEEIDAKHRLPAPPSRLAPSVPPAVDRLVLGLLEPDPGRRMPAPEALAALREHAAPREDAEAPRARASRLPLAAEAELDFVAREAELGALRDAFAAAQQGQLVTVDVVGPSGMGKTVLVRRFLRDLEGAGPAPPLVLEARCHPYESIPYKAFDAAIDDLARYWVGLDEASAAALCPAEGAEALALLFPELRRVPVVDAKARSGAARGDPRALRQSGFAALRVVLAHAAARQPVVLWVDDAQWADADSVALVESVFGGEDPPHVALVLSRRPAGETPQPALLEALSMARSRGKSVEIELAPLGAGSAVALARAITARAGAGAEAVLEIVEEAGGVPYLVAELAHFAAAARTAEGARGLTTTATSLLHERLQALSDEDRALVEVAALSGAAQRAAVLLEAAGSRDRRRLRDLCLLRLLRWAGAGEEETLQIYHDRLREFVAGALPKEVSARHHAALVSAMEAAGSDDAEQLMAHALAAGDRPRTRRHAMTAARRAEAALAFEQAARLYRVALEHTAGEAPCADLHALLAEALANAGRSTDAAPAFERAARALAEESPREIERRGLYRRRAGEQYLKAGRFDEGLRLMEAFLGESRVRLPTSGNGALLVSAGKRLRLYLRGFDFEARPPGAIAPSTRRRLDDLWAATTALSMMDPVRADGVGLLHFLEALREGDSAHIARSLGYEAAFAALIGGGFLRARSRDLVRRNERALEGGAAPYERAFYLLGAGSSAFFHSDWDRAARLCDAAAVQFRAECRGAEYEAAVAIVFSLQALGQAGRVGELVARIPAAIREAEARGDLFAANNYRGGFHGVGRLAAGRVDEVATDLRKVVETWKSGFYQMHAYHRVFSGVALDLYVGDPRSAVARIEGDWPELRDGLFLRMELPAMELRWTRARAALALAGQSGGSARRALLRRVRELVRAIGRATVLASRPHASLLLAGLAATEGRSGQAQAHLRSALAGYTAARMAIHREVARWALGRVAGGREGARHIDEAGAWMSSEGVPDMTPLARAIAPGVERAFGGPGVA
ncbi:MULTISPECIES: serine/threonine-protein kinase PknK [Sorangium]|uniref:non-specific serine/threonine protein kinase n=1 Tax=Sorangium cellulosum TaxID=56 RepID=A0A4P2QTA4_SORCE|nr:MULTISPECIES: serine/threonine-protein kinase [Sorangium]AUX33510.1 protein kinase [Sorangium cellulosum]WCQ92826.1 serine-threonine kinase [Sorangium sp. Soce836]